MCVTTEGEGQKIKMQIVSLSKAGSRKLKENMQVKSDTTSSQVAITLQRNKQGKPASKLGERLSKRKQARTQQQRIR